MPENTYLNNTLQQQSPTMIKHENTATTHFETNLLARFWFTTEIGVLEQLLKSGIVVVRSLTPILHTVFLSSVLQKLAFLRGENISIFEQFPNIYVLSRGKKGGNYSREEIIQGRILYKKIRYLIYSHLLNNRGTQINVQVAIFPKK